MFKYLLISALLFFIGYRIMSFFARVSSRGKKQQNSQQRNRRYSSPQEEKKFSKDIGEYVSYEEVKDDDKLNS